MVIKRAVNVKLVIPRTDVSNAQALINVKNAKSDPTFTIPKNVRNARKIVLSVIVLLPFNLNSLDLLLSPKLALQ